MRVLAARFMANEKARGIARVAAVAAPMVLLECSGATDKGASNPVHPVVVDVPAPPRQLEREGNSAVEGAKKPENEAKKETVLNASIYPGCIISARLSVIKQDNSLEKIILDPKASFAYGGGNTYGLSDMRPILCSGTHECDISGFVRANLPATHFRSHPNKTDIDVIVSFRPESGSRLAPSETTLRITRDEISAYCH